MLLMEVSVNINVCIYFIICQGVSLGNKIKVSVSMLYMQNTVLQLPGGVKVSREVSLRKFEVKGNVISTHLLHQDSWQTPSMSPARVYPSIYSDALCQTDFYKVALKLLITRSPKDQSSFKLVFACPIKSLKYVMQR